MTDIITVNSSFTRPANTTAYAPGDLVANSATAASVVAPTFALGVEKYQNIFVRRIKLRKSGTSITSASFRVHLYKVAPTTIANGDNGAFSTSGIADYIGAVDVTMDRAFTDGAFGVGIPMTGSELNAIVESGSICALVESRAAYTPASAEVFTVEIEAHRY